MRRLQDALRRRLRREATLPRRPRRRPTLRRRIHDARLLVRFGEQRGQPRRSSHRRPLARARRRLRSVRRLASRRAQPSPRRLPTRALPARALPRRRPIDVPVHASILGIGHERRRRVYGHRLRRFESARRRAGADARPARRRQRPRRRALEIRLHPGVRVRDVRIGVEIVILWRREFPPASRARARGVSRRRSRGRAVAKASMI